MGRGLLEVRAATGAAANQTPRFGAECVRPRARPLRYTWRKGQNIGSALTRAGKPLLIAVAPGATRGYGALRAHYAAR